MRIFLVLILLTSFAHAALNVSLDARFGREKLQPFFDVLKKDAPSSNALQKQRQEFQELTGINPEEIKVLNSAFLVIGKKRLNIAPILEAVAKFQSLPAQIISAQAEESYDTELQKIGFLVRVRFLQKSQLQPLSESLILFSHDGKALALGSNLSQILVSMEPYVYLNNYFVWERGQFKGMHNQSEVLVYKNGIQIKSIVLRYEPQRLQEGVPVPPYLTFEKVPNLPYTLVGGGILFDGRFTPISPALGKTYPQYAVATTGNILVFRNSATSPEHAYKFLNLRTGKVFQPEAELQAQGYDIDAPRTYENESFLAEGMVTYYVRSPKPEDWVNAESRSQAELKKSFTPALKKYIGNDAFQISKIELMEDKNNEPDMEITYTPGARGVERSQKQVGEPVKNLSLFYQAWVSIRSGFLNTKTQVLYIKESQAPTYNIQIFDQLENN